MDTTLPLIAIFLYTKFDLNGNSIFSSLVCSVTDGQSGDYMLPISGSITNAGMCVKLSS